MTSQVGVCSLDTGILGASFNVAINLGQLTDREYQERVIKCVVVSICLKHSCTTIQIQKEVDMIVKESEEKRHALLTTLTTRLQHKI